MCLSKFNQLIYGTLVLFVIALTLASLFTPGWRKIETELKNGSATEFINETIHKGLFPFGCAEFNISAEHGDQLGNATELCQKWWEEQPTYEKVVIALMALALAVSLAALVWNVLTFFCCLGRGGIFRPLPSLAGTAAVCLLVALALYYFNNSKDIEFIKSLDKLKHLDAQGNVSYSFYLALGALLLSLANVVVGGFVVQTAERCL